MTQLTGTWRLVLPDVTWAGAGPDLTFEGDGQVYGCAGINRVRGTWQLDDDVLTFGPVATTLMAGPPEAMAGEQQVLALLGMPLRVATDGADVVLTADDGAGARLTPAEPTRTV